MLQVNALFVGVPCKRLRGDLKTGYSYGLRLMKYSIIKCGDFEAGLGMYATGKCGGAMGLVHRRLKLLEKLPAAPPPAPSASASAVPTDS